MSDIKIEYQGWWISYSESQNHWRVESDWDRGYESLEKAKAAVDRHENPKDKKKFDAYEAVLWSYADDEPQKVTVTSVSDEDVWIKIPTGENRFTREKLRFGKVAKRLTPLQESSVKEWLELDAQIESLRKKRGELVDRAKAEKA